MENTRHVEVVRELYAAFGKGDASALLQCLTDDVVFTMPEMPGVPLSTRYVGKRGIEEFLRDRAPVLEYDEFEPRRFFSDQDTVLVLGETAGRVRTSGRKFRYTWVQLFEFGPNDLIRRLHEFLDTNVLVNAFASRGRGSGD
ncbi:MAG TPA: nuclear transport factor 2 family protein [Thermoanaerobaculia bacterium]|nr:nuclear transport factor 2 family protein [Thermoanaerobaculia bacterium]